MQVDTTVYMENKHVNNQEKKKRKKKNHPTNDEKDLALPKAHCIVKALWLKHCGVGTWINK